MRNALPLMTLGLLLALSPRSASAQMWFEGDYLFWGRANTSSQPYVNGGTSSEDADFGFGDGFRLTLGSGLGNYEVEAVFSQIGDWTGDGNGTLALPVAFDATSTNAIVFPGGAGTLAFNSGLALSASQPGETTESEFLTAGSFFTHSYSSKLQDIQINFGSHRDLNWIRWGIGYREIVIDENGGFGLSGTFDALDVDDAAGPTTPFNNDPNDGLSSGSLAAVGFVNVAGGGGFDSINPTIPSADRLAWLLNGVTENRLDGVQFLVAARGAPNDVISLEAFARVGLYYNRVNGSVNELIVGSGDANGVFVRTLGDSTARASFGFNPGIRSALNLTDYISLTAGYEFMVLTGIGLGPDQFAQVQTSLLGGPTYKVDADGVFFGHGGNIGLEVRW